MAIIFDEGDEVDGAAGDMTDVHVLAELAANISELTLWEQRFVIDVRKVCDDGRALSPARSAKLREIYEQRLASDDDEEEGLAELDFGGSP